jgi:hypothetical protein
MNDIWTWIVNFLGVNNTYNDFSTHMYNFWSGFGSGVIQISLIGTIIWLYHHYQARLKKLDTLIHKPLEKIEERLDTKTKQ